MVAQDESVYEMVKEINSSIERVCLECKKIFNFFNAFSFLWTNDIHDIFEDFLKGAVSLSRDKNSRPPSKNFMTNRTSTK